MTTPHTFVAVDFETANAAHWSACAVGAVQIRDLQIERKISFVLQCATDDFQFSGLHGITREQCDSGVPFERAWLDLHEALRATEFRVVAHNASFDRRVLESCARRAHIRLPRLRWTCSRNLAEAALGLRPADLATVCRHLRIPLQHHDPVSDAEAAARIVIACIHEKLAHVETEGAN